MGMTTPDSRIVLRGGQIGLANDPIVDHPGQPADYVHTDGTVWTWRERWRLVGGVQDDEGWTGRAQLRMYDLVVPGTGPDRQAPSDANTWGLSS
jgi:hypothetical protein